jgi:osmotically-inducible protein OsmY
MANLTAAQDATGHARPKGPEQALLIRSGWQVFCHDDPGPVGRVDRSSRYGADQAPLLVSAGWRHRAVRRVPSEAVLSAGDRQVRLRIARAEFLDLGHYLPDQEVVASVWDSLRDFMPFRYLRSASVTVTSADGVVTLSGHVTHEGNRRQAVRCAEKADGVVRVRDRLVSDEHLTSAVARSLLSHPGLQPSLVRVSARFGAVELEGDLPSEALIGVATSAASSVAGVTRLVNRLRVTALKTAPQTRLRA